MSTIRQILAATDFSVAADDAVARAALLAADRQMRLSLLNVVSRGALDVLHDLMAPDSSSVLEARLLEEARRNLSKLADELAHRFRVQADVQVSVGNVLREIECHAERVHADLLVLGARGEGFMREVLLGSTTEALLCSAPRPLLAVKRAPDGCYRRVLVPVDFAGPKCEAVELAAALAPEAERVFLHAFEVPYEGKLRYAGVDESAVNRLRVAAREQAAQSLDTMIAALALPEHRVRRVLLHGPPGRRILEQAEELDCDLIAIGRRGKKGTLEAFILGSVTQQVLAHAGCDVLVANGTGR